MNERIAVNAGAWVAIFAATSAALGAFGVFWGKVSDWWLVVNTNRRAAKKAEEAPRPEPKQYEKYGHPVSPVQLLKHKLPKPPKGFAWEIRVEVSEETGNPTMHLALVDASLVRIEETVPLDLIEYEDFTAMPFSIRYESEEDREAVRKLRMRSYAHDYRTRGGRFQYEISKLTNWAVEQRDKYTRYETSGEYELVTE